MENSVFFSLTKNLWWTLDMGFDLKPLEAKSSSTNSWNGSFEQRERERQKMVRTTKKKIKLPEASQKEEAKDRDNVVFFFRPQQ
jgi:hypothetical protein